MKKNVFIFSKLSDWTTAEVANWLTKYYGCDITRINTMSWNRDAVSILLQPPKPRLTYNGVEPYSVWLRYPPKAQSFENDALESATKRFMSEELIEFEAFTNSIIRSQYRVLGQSSQFLTPFSMSKLDCLLKAAEFGISVPNTVISNSKREILAFLKKYPKCIIKPISNPIFVLSGQKSLSMYTKIVDPSFIEEFDEFLFPVLVQEYIEKEFEVRIFYLDGEFYSSAIFSQNDESTRVDYRNYNQKEPNRVVPYRLPVKVSRKLRKLFNFYHLNTGSADMIFTPDQKLIFLEINPIGQFGMVSAPCNYYLEQKVAQFLCQ